MSAVIATLDLCIGRIRISILDCLTSFSTVITFYLQIINIAFMSSSQPKHEKSRVIVT